MAALIHIFVFLVPSPVKNVVKSANNEKKYESVTWWPHYIESFLKDSDYKFGKIRGKHVPEFRRCHALHMI